MATGKVSRLFLVSMLIGVAAMVTWYLLAAAP